MGNLFSSSSKKKKDKYLAPEITEVDKAILSLKTQKKRLEDQSKLLENRMDTQKEAAKQLLAEKRKERALLMLKKKKLTEQQLHQLQNLLFKVEEMVRNVEMNKQNNKIFDVLKEGNQALKTMQTQWSVEDVKKLMDDSAEAQQYQEELSVVLGQSLTDEDNTEVESELEALEALVADAARLELPSVPAKKVPNLPPMQKKQDIQKEDDAAAVSAAAVAVLAS